MENVPNIVNNVTYIGNVKYAILITKIILEQKKMIMKKLNVATQPLLMDIITLQILIIINIFINV